MAPPDTAGRGDVRGSACAAPREDEDAALLCLRDATQRNAISNLAAATTTTGAVERAGRQADAHGSWEDEAGYVARARDVLALKCCHSSGRGTRGREGGGRADLKV